jgi:hypothetical protein
MATDVGAAHQMMGEAPRKVGRDRGRDRDRAAILHRNLQKIYYLQMEVGLSRQVTLRVKIRIGKSENDSLRLLFCKSTSLFCIGFHSRER